jgi:hypothetical protein
MSEPTTGYEHLPTSELPKLRKNLAEALLSEETPSEHKRELYQDLEYVNAEITKRVVACECAAELLDSGHHAAGCPLAN